MSALKKDEVTYWDRDRHTDQTYGIEDNADSYYSSFNVENENIANQEHNSHSDDLSAVNSLYGEYIKMQKEQPNAIVIQRIGDFYEVMGDKAKVVADSLI